MLFEKKKKMDKGREIEALQTSITSPTFTTKESAQKFTGIQTPSFFI